jgi:agmatine deiminase
MPAEWEPHVSTWFTWPRPEGISFPDKYDPVPPVYAALIRELVKVEEVNINVWNAEMEEWVRGLLRKEKTPLECVRVHHFSAYEPWCRDHGRPLPSANAGPTERCERCNGKFHGLMTPITPKG